METSAWNKRIYERLIKINVNKYNLVPYEKNKWIIIINIIIIIKNTWFLEYATPENVTSIRYIWESDSITNAVLFFTYIIVNQKKAFICAYFYLFTLYITLEYQNIFIDNFVT